MIHTISTILIGEGRLRHFAKTVDDKMLKVLMVPVKSMHAAITILRVQSNPFYFKNFIKKTNTFYKSTTPTIRWMQKKRKEKKKEGKKRKVPVGTKFFALSLECGH